MMGKKILFLMLCFCINFCAISYAHPPSQIEVVFNKETKELSATIVHPVSNSAKHWINKVDIGLNGEEIIEQKISRQEENGQQTVRYYISDAKAGDTISVEAYCSVSGVLKKEVVVSE